MTLADDVDLEEFITAKDDLSGADIKAVCTEAGLLALRERPMRVMKSDVSRTAREKVGHISKRHRGVSSSVTEVRVHTVLLYKLPSTATCSIRFC